MPGETSEIVAHSSTSNKQLLDISKKNQPCENQKKTTGKRKKAFHITLMFHFRSNMHHLNPATPKHEEFLGISNFMRHTTIECQRSTQIPYDKFNKVT